MGRRTKLTPDLQSKICSVLQVGNYIETAAAYAGVSKTTLYKWLKRGRREQSGQYTDFVAAVEQALAHSEVDAIAHITKAGHENWQALAWRLERRFPAKWGKREKLTQNVTVDWRAQAKKDGIADVDGLFEQLVQAAMDRRSDAGSVSGSDAQTSGARQD
jgi:transposase